MADEGEPTVTVTVQDRILVITINRPAVRNAVNGDVAQRIAAAVHELDSDVELRVGVLTGAGGTFCSGMDLKALLADDLPWVEGKGFGGLTQSPPRKPLIAAVEGWAVAGGFELMLACDLVVASETSAFGVPEVKLATVAGGGAAMKLPQRIPTAIALEMLLTGDTISAPRAAELGLVNRVTGQGEALSVALELASAIAANGPLAVVATKQIARSAAEWSPADEWSEQDRLVGPVYESRDAKEGASAFAEKRAPVWFGR
ncbi:crotonase/enoyl-CoA hydratase family protein [Williamsia muralis]|uniref:Enoyl-CoA hydratase n=1 Tax=Williamsia marianensis TaxID=85044 RepID=A0A2G3PNU0_WILMA|nr:crotonase/enoyl-CoA hydratase family protein [Williamsia marianensis]PHV67403.1 enoyl-CoA hydratase [Williamsia marianensis]